MSELTKRQREVLKYIKDFAVKNYYQPSIREVGEHFGIGFVPIRDHLFACQKKGYIRVEHGRPRGIEFLREL